MSSSSTTSKTPPRHIVVIGGGVQASSVAYHLSKSQHLPPSSKITILESKSIASAASGKGGGFMARSWGDGGPTQSLHHISFDMYPQLASDVGCDHVFRTLPVLSVSPGTNNRGIKNFNDDKQLLPSWLDGNTGRIGVMGYGDDTAQITPLDFTRGLVEKSGAEVILGTAVGVDCTIINDNDNDDTDNEKRVTGVRYVPRSDGEDKEEKLLECTDVVVSAGPWSCIAEEWFDTVRLPMEGVKSTSIVWKNPFNSDDDQKTKIPDARALFCGEDDRFQTHLEVYPRPDGTIYLCGIGGSDYIPSSELKRGAYREECLAKPDRIAAATASFQEISKTYRNKGELDKTQSCMRPCPPDAMPYIGRIPDVQGAYINAGHNCWGIAWAPACGLAMSELVLEGKCTTVDLSPFDPARFVPRKDKKKGGGRGRKRGGESVGEQW